MKEEWKDYRTKCSNIRVSSLGNVTGKWFGKPVKIHIVGGYRCIGSKVAIYKLVDYLFRGHLEKGWVVHHKNHKKTDDRLCNLVRMTRSEHIKHHNLTMSDERKDSVSDKMQGNKNGVGNQNTKNMHWYNNGSKNNMFRTDEEAAEKGYVRGRLINVNSKYTSTENI